MEDLWLENYGTPLKEAIVARKRQLKQQFDYKRAFDDIRRLLEPEVNRITQQQSNAVPELDYQTLLANRVSGDSIAQIHQSGCCIIRGVFARDRVAQWNQDIEHYIDDNDYVAKSVAKAELDKYFSQLAASKPMIFGLYWSKPQIEARQSQELAHTRRFLNGLWLDYQGVFDPNLECSYADRIRRRAPGDTTLGLSPHVDGGSVERWLDAGYGAVYADVFNGNLVDYQPFSAAHRTETREVPSPAVCRMFRTYQGWTALTLQGKGDGTLNVIPLAKAMAYMLLRALQDDIPDDDLCGAQPGRALTVDPTYHEFILNALTPIPKVEAGDTVWWHSDVVHAVEDEHQGSGYSNVIYIGAAPDCQKNRDFLKLQREAFIMGESSPDFAAENYEVDFKNRASRADLTELGARQMGF